MGQLGTSSQADPTVRQVGSSTTQADGMDDLVAKTRKSVNLAHVALEASVMGDR